MVLLFKESENLWNSLPLKFYVKSILAILDDPKTAILSEITTHKALNLDFWYILAKKNDKNSRKSRSGASEIVKMAYF